MEVCPERFDLQAFCKEIKEFFFVKVLKEKNKGLLITPQQSLHQRQHKAVAKTDQSSVTTHSRERKMAEETTQKDNHDILRGHYWSEMLGLVSRGSVIVRQ